MKARTNILRKGEKGKNTMLTNMVKMNCDKCCANCSHSTSHGTWLECMLDSSEVSPNGYCKQYN